MILMILSFCLLCQTAFAVADETTAIGMDNSSTDNVVEVSNNEYHDSVKISQDNQNDLSKSQNTTLFIISDNPGTNILDKASWELHDEGKLNNVNLIIRNGEQVKGMDEAELMGYLSGCDAFIGEWISTDVDSVLTSALTKNPELSNKRIFLILEPPSGNVNSGSSSINLIKNNTLDYNRIFSSVSNNKLVNYFAKTKRGLSYSSVVSYLDSEGKDFNSFFNRLVLYKDLNDKDNLKNQILCILNYLGLDVEYENPTFTGSKTYGIYREKWYSLDEYVEKFFDSSRNRTVGVLESTMYIDSQQLHTCYSIIESLEARDIMSSLSLPQEDLQTSLG